MADAGIGLKKPAVIVSKRSQPDNWRWGCEMYHILYTTIDGEFVSVEKKFPSFAAVEQWLRSIGATYWEIGGGR